MKKLYTLILVIVSYSALAQSPYYDALELSKLIAPASGKFDATNDAKLQMAGNILAKYVQHPDSIATFADIKERFEAGGSEENPFITPYIPGSGSSVLPVSGSASGLGSTNVTAFADGLAKFLIKRSKQELYVSFFQNFPEFLKKYPEFEKLFPKSTMVIHNFKSWEYANVLNTLKEALEKDLKQLPSNLQSILEIDTSETSVIDQKAIERIKKIKAWLQTNEGLTLMAGLYLGNQFLSGNKLSDVISSVGSKENISRIQISNKALEANLKSSLAFIRIMSNAVRSNNVTRSYISEEDFRLAFADNVTRDLFIGLIYQQLRNENVAINGKPVINYINRSTINGTMTYIQNFITESQNVTTAIKQLQKVKRNGGTDASAEWAAVLQSVYNFIPVATNTEVISPALALPEEFKNVVNKSQDFITISHDIAVKNYSAAIVDLMDILPETDDKDLNDFKAFILKYGSFAANVVQAENSDDVEKAIESVALPVGSASIKKNTSFSIAVNAYLGGFYGNEYLAGKVDNKWAPISGVYAPVGVTFSWGINKDGSGSKFLDFFVKDFSLSAFVSIVDIGAIASYRLEDPTTEKLPEVKLQNIFAPGLGIVYGFPKFPLSVGYSYQLGPELRQINAEQAETSQPNHRWQFFIAVDIPIFNLYAKTK